MSLFSDVPLAPPDAIFHLTASFKEDVDPRKVNLGIGAYRTEDGKPWVLPAVQQAIDAICADPAVDHEYLPITGLPAFTEAAARLMLGEDSPAIREKRYFACQSISGTGANYIGALLLSKWVRPGGTCLISNPTWGNHRPLYTMAGLNVEEYKYWDAQTLGLDLDGMLASLVAAPDGSIVVLHSCAHNPTGVDPTHEQWERIADVMQRKGHIAFFDSAYQGFASGDVDRDAWAVRHFVSRGMECVIAQSFAKNFGLYGERIGCLIVVAKSAQDAQQAGSQVAKLVRATYSNPPAFGARIVARVLTQPDLLQEWDRNIKTMSSRIHTMRYALRQELEALQTPGTWNHITDQIGMFSYTGLRPTQVRVLRDSFHIYLLDSGRISMAGLNSSNVKYVAAAFDHVVRHVQ